MELIGDVLVEQASTQHLQYVLVSFRLTENPIITEIPVPAETRSRRLPPQEVQGRISSRRASPLMVSETVVLSGKVTGSLRLEAVVDLLFAFWRRRIN